MKRSIYIIFSLGVTVGVAYYLFSSISLADIKQLILEIDRTLLIIFICLSFIMSFFRMWRYAYVLNALGYKPSLIALYLVTIVRNLFADLLPARIGTIIYIYLVNTRLKIPLSAASSSFAIAFLFDILAIFPIIIMIALLSSAADINYTAITISALLLFVISLLLLISLPKLLKLTSKAKAIFPETLQAKLESLLSKTASELGEMQSFTRNVKLLLLSLLIRVTKYSQLYVLLLALLIPTGYTIEQLPVPESLLGICAAEISASLPLSGIAGFGLYEGTWALVFQLVGLPAELAKASGLSHHLITQVWGYGLGVVALLLLLIPISSRSPSNSEQNLEL